jgi:hypothetical protein
MRTTHRDYCNRRIIYLLRTGELPQFLDSRLVRKQGKTQNLLVSTNYYYVGQHNHHHQTNPRHKQAQTQTLYQVSPLYSQLQRM